jgi:hypothetical protein
MTPVGAELVKQVFGLLEYSRFLRLTNQQDDVVVSSGAHAQNERILFAEAGSADNGPNESSEPDLSAINQILNSLEARSA